MRMNEPGSPITDTASAREMSTEERQKYFAENVVRQRTPTLSELAALLTHTRALLDTLSLGDRSISMAKTKLDEAELWLGKYFNR